jgi:signal transduction histidine kinase
MTLLVEPVYFLLVDDLEENLLALEALLKRDGLVLLKARSGPEALELLLKHDVALALLDVQMPGMDGFELAELMRGPERTRRVPIIFLTAGAADSQRKFRGYEAGGVDFLVKPIEPHILRSKCEIFFQIFRQRQEVALQRDQLQAAHEENQRLLAESRRQADALREADKRKDDFLAMLAHELRNPLAPISSSVEILRIDPSGQNQVEAREVIGRQVAHMSHIIDDLLDVARIARGKIELRSEPCDLNVIAQQTADDYAQLFISSDILFERDFAPGALPILGDKVRLAQVIGNLLHNAAKFTSAGGRVRLRTCLDQPSRMAEVMVSDTGAGLDASTLSRVFEPFSQVNPTVDRGKGGLGLGLALAQGLIRLHQGSIFAHSAGIGKGAVFSFTVPVASAARPEGGTTVRPPAPASHKPLKILLVEDNHDSAISLQRLLTMIGHQVEVAFDGETGLEIARQFLPDVVLSDLGLPGKIDGYTLARIIREEWSARPPRLVALSGYGHEQARDKTSQAGFDVHLVKPVDFGALSNLLEQVAPR